MARQYRQGLKHPYLQCLALITLVVEAMHPNCLPHFQQEMLLSLQQQVSQLHHRLLQPALPRLLSHQCTHSAAVLVLARLLSTAWSLVQTELPSCSRCCPETAQEYAQRQQHHHTIQRHLWNRIRNKHLFHLNSSKQQPCLFNDSTNNDSSGSSSGLSLLIQLVTCRDDLLP